MRVQPLAFWREGLLGIPLRSASCSAPLAAILNSANLKRWAGRSMGGPTPPGKYPEPDLGEMLWGYRCYRQSPVPGRFGNYLDARAGRAGYGGSWFHSRRERREWESRRIIDCLLATARQSYESRTTSRSRDRTPVSAKVRRDTQPPRRRRCRTLLSPRQSPTAPCKSAGFLPRCRGWSAQQSYR